MVLNEVGKNIIDICCIGKIFLKDLFIARFPFLSLRILINDVPFNLNKFLIQVVFDALLIETIGFDRVCLVWKVTFVVNVVERCLSFGEESIYISPGSKAENWLLINITCVSELVVKFFWQKSPFVQEFIVLQWMLFRNIALPWLYTWIS